jgi:hypothetical protein
MDYLNSDHLQLADFNPVNRQRYVEKPDRNFSAQRNYQIIQETINDNEKWQLAADRKLERKVGNTADMLASYGMYRLGRGGTKKVEDYLGKDLMAKIYGEKLMSKLRVMDSIRKLNLQQGNTLNGGYTYMPGKD